MKRDQNLNAMILRALKSCFFILISTLHLHALPASQTSSAAEHLLAVNANWNLQFGAFYSPDISFSTDVERIKFHLSEVITRLKAKKGLPFDNSALKNRSKLLLELEHYAAIGQFPTNNKLPFRNPVFIDDYGVHCAVGYLILASGNGDLAQEINAFNQLDYIQDINNPQLDEWAESHGFLKEELALIQPGYTYSEPVQPIGKGVNDKIEGLLVQSVPGSNDYKTLFWGKYTELNGQACKNIGEFYNGGIQCFGNGLEGKINDVRILSGNNIMLTGSFPKDGKTYPLAYYRNFKWNYMDIPNASGKEATVVSAEGFFPSLNMIVAVYDESKNESEFWEYNYSDEIWKHTASVNGVVRTADNESQSFFGGYFTELRTYDETGNENIIPCTNLVGKYYKSAWYNPNLGQLPDSVLDIKYIRSTLYIAGSCKGEGGTGVCLSRYFNGVNQPLILHYQLAFGDTNEYFIKSIAPGTNQSKIMFAGNFHVGDGMYYGKHLGEFSLL
ncbi:MAG: hypothetical protein ACPF8V_08510, partial [Luteibaculum sp.]